MVTGDEIEERTGLIDASADLRSLRDRLLVRARPLIDRMPVVPEVKALLSRDGGVCAADGTALLFDPWSPDAHRCPRCGREYRGERHHRAWARFQHLWLAERAGHLAAVAATARDAAAGRRAEEILAAYAGYEEYPNRDNVLGPARLFFSTYLESIWLTNYLGAATLLRETGLLSGDTEEIVSGVADQAAALIGEFDEGFSNRQTWHNAALAAVGVRFQDEALAARAIESDTGLLAHLAHGFGADGTWSEGENYHLFALQGLLGGIGWARSAGVDALADPDLARRLFAALHAPCLSALPDLTFAARKDSRFGISLAQPMYLELWEIGLGMLQRAGHDDADGLASWLRALYAQPAPPAQTFESCLDEAGEPAPARRSRADLSWRALLQMRAELPADDRPWEPGAVLLESQGLAVLRRGDRYATLECGAWVDGHGHPDRLNLTLHQDGVHWLPDFGTGSYVTPDLFWYRSTLAHNAPRIDGTSQPGGDAECTAFADGDGDADGWAWARGVWGEITRTVVAGPRYLVDVVEPSTVPGRVVELPWHLAGEWQVASPGQWKPAGLADPFIESPEQFEPADATVPIVVTSRSGESTLVLRLAFTGTLIRATAPGAPGTGAAPFLLQRTLGGQELLVAVLDRGDAVTGLQVEGSRIRIETTDGIDVHAGVSDGWAVETESSSVRLGGVRARGVEFRTLFQPRHERMSATAAYVAEPPALDGSLAGFPADASVALDHEDQYRRSEDPYEGPESFSATASIAWDAEALYLAVDVRKAELAFRPPDAPPLLLDNEVDDIHSDGLQVYLRHAGGPPTGVLAVPEPGGGLRIRSVGGSGDATARGGWRPTDDGYRVTLALAAADWGDMTAGGRLEFDLIVNEMRGDRERRAGQLVWSGGGGWVWLRGDRQDPSRFGILELA